MLRLTTNINGVSGLGFHVVRLCKNEHYLLFKRLKDIIDIDGGTLGR
jgi:hypothetical protein